MTFQYERTKTLLDLLKLEIKSYIERLEEILDEISEKEKKIVEDKTH